MNFAKYFSKGEFKDFKKYRQHGTTFHNIVPQTSGLRNWIAQGADQCKFLRKLSKASIKKEISVLEFLPSALGEKLVIKPLIYDNHSMSIIWLQNFSFEEKNLSVISFIWP